jgi:hypothetical protein
VPLLARSPLRLAEITHAWTDGLGIPQPADHS